MRLQRLQLLLAPVATGALLFALSPAALAVVDCSIISQRSQRDATCIGSVNNVGARPDSNAELSQTLRGSNALPIRGSTPPPQQATNECVSTLLTTWAYDPVSFSTPAPSFISQTGAGYLGSGGSDAPTSSCPSDTDGSCEAWVPADYPYLFTGDSKFVYCSGSLIMGSKSCPVKGGLAYVTTNPNAGSNFSASMISCKKGNPPPSSMIAGAPVSWWTSCMASSQCSFNLVYPTNPDEDGRRGNGGNGDGGNGG